jgi:hypothetical protein
LAESIAACSEPARPPASAACPELARLTAPAAFVLASAQVGLADSQSAKLSFLVPVAIDASSDDLAPIVDHSIEMKSNIIQIRDVHCSNMINKVENTNILFKFQSGHTISISASIRDILASSCKRPIENGIIFVGDKINSDPIG